MSEEFIITQPEMAEEDRESAQLSSGDESSSTARTSGSSFLQIASKENVLVFCSKTVVLGVLLFTACASSLGVFTIAINSENSAFREEVLNRATEITYVSQLNARAVFRAMESVATTTTLYVQDQSLEFPFVHLPHFQDRIEQLSDAPGIGGVMLNMVVAESQKEAWIEYAKSRVEEEKDNDFKHLGNTSITECIRLPPNVTGGGKCERAISIYGVVSQTFPHMPSMVITNILSVSAVMRSYKEMQKMRTTALTTFQNLDLEPLDQNDVVYSIAVVPVFEGLGQKGNISAFYTTSVSWKHFFYNVLPEGSGSIIVVVHSKCDDMVASFKLEGDLAYYLGSKDLHDSRFEEFKFIAPFDVLDRNLVVGDDHCSFDMLMYPTFEYYKLKTSQKPIFYASAILGIFALTTLVFVIYDRFVEKRQAKVMSSAQRSNAIVSSLFPAQIRDRLLGENESVGRSVASRVPILDIPGDDMDDDEEIDLLISTKPIADLFPSASVLFADVVGFTAWSSVREPTQVFTLLERIYSSFDQIAKRRKIFKVETIGDCYVAASGLPEKRDDHAIVICRFSHECRARMNSVVKKLEVTLGPDTGELSMRFGIHSGPVTAGVLRGDKSRFQLFGDTVNTASRIETTGAANMIHVSQQTANLLMDAGKEDWIVPREELITAKGKGTMQTYWLTMRDRRGNKYGESQAALSDNMSTVNTESCDYYDFNINQRSARLVDWTVDILHKQLKKIIAMRKPLLRTAMSARELGLMSSKLPNHRSTPLAETGMTVLDEVKEIIPLSAKVSKYRRDPDSIQLGETVVNQLRDYVSIIAAMYHNNPFHNYEHASHVVQSVTKLMARIVTTDDIDFADMKYKTTIDTTDLHDHTFGITSDPLIHFACIFSAMIHDVDHCGLPNAQLVKEGREMAKLYGNKSVAEQNSVNLAWELLMEPAYNELRECIFSNQEELDRFRHLVVNSVMATDIVDKELGALRKKRWAKAFAVDGAEDDIHSEVDKVNRKATIVIEHLIQASDVSHTMQHWHVYIKWNENLFDEMYQAYKNGQADTDPSVGWYEGELGFFDHYIIPLAKKLGECGVFGVSSDELLNYAQTNREEWKVKGKHIIKKYLKKYA